MTWLKFTDNYGREKWCNMALVRLVTVEASDCVELDFSPLSKQRFVNAEAISFLAAFREAAVKP